MDSLKKNVKTLIFCDYKTNLTCSLYLNAAIDELILIFEFPSWFWMKKTIHCVCFKYENPCVLNLLLEAVIYDFFVV